MSRTSIILTAGLVSAGCLSALAAAAATGGGFAAGFRPSAGQVSHQAASILRLKRLDMDRDGAVTRAEFLHARTLTFAALDANKDGSVDGEEMAAPWRDRAAVSDKRFLKRLDTDGDGRISASEYEAGPRARFQARDLDGDGKITAADLPPGRRVHPTAGAAATGQRSDVGPGARRPFARQDTLEAVATRAAADFKRRDANGDGFIDVAELASETADRQAYQLKRAMHRADTNGDGRVSPEEFAAPLAKRFATLDLNDDGRIAADDLAAPERALWERRR